jgi:hypothetical protein
MGEQPLRTAVAAEGMGAAGMAAEAADMGAAVVSTAAEAADTGAAVVFMAAEEGFTAVEEGFTAVEAASHQGFAALAASEGVRSSTDTAFMGLAETEDFMAITSPAAAESSAATAAWGTADSAMAALVPQVSDTADSDTEEPVFSRS